MIKLNLNENFICRIWEDNSFYDGLKTTDDEIVTVIEYGEKNYDAGPDYKNARVKIGEKIYYGSIEIHRSASDWFHHNHKGDNKYNDVILHVAFYDEENSPSPLVKKSRSIPTIVLSKFLTSSIHRIWKEIINTPTENFRLPCHEKINLVPDLVKADWLGELSKARLIYKTERIRSRLAEISTQANRKIFWEQVLYEFICEALGYSKNKEQFLKLAKKVDVEKISGKNLTRSQLDALLFGTAGFLKDLRFRDPYIDELKSSWQDLRKIFSNETIDRSEWNFFRLRPANFPSIRIAFASGLLNEIANKEFLKTVINIFESSSNLFRDMQKLFCDINVSGYWQDHYNFGKESNSPVSAIGSERVKDITVNVLLPVVYLYSIEFKNSSLKSRVEFFYKKEKQRSKSNEVTRVMEKQIDVKVFSVSDEQALIHLHNFFCMKGRCSECDIGKVVFGNEMVHEPLKIILY
ncbi:MAG: DUF2851 family protein [bacterium]|nr:DUF2851 family protein [bacterium]